MTLEGTRRLLAPALAMGIGSVGMAHAQPAAYPVKPVRLVVGYAPGGGADIMGRLIAQQITEATGQQVVVENRPGAGQNIGSEFVAKSPADGYTLLMSSSALGINGSLYPKLAYDPVKDFAPIAVFAASPNLLLVHPSLPAKTVKEFIAVAKKSSRGLSYSSSGSGSTQHLSGELLRLMTGINIVHVPYKGSAPSLTALVSGEVDFAFNNVPSAKPFMTNARLRALAITSPKRSALLPELPTMIESGLPGFVVAAWYGVLGPAGTPPQVITFLNGLIVKSVQRPEFKSRMAQMGADTIEESPEYFRAFLAEEISRWASVVKASGAKPE